MKKKQHKKIERFAGISLGGGKTDKTAVAVIEYFPEQNRAFLRGIRDKVRTEGRVSSDRILHDILTELEAPISLLAFDVPLQIPKCLRCKLKCPGYEKCKEPEIRWMWEHLNRKKTRHGKIFTPYTERCVEIYLNDQLEEPFYPGHAMGANAAPLMARAHFVRRRLSIESIEVFVRLSLWRIGMALKIPKSHLRFHRHAVDSDESRFFILKSIMEKQFVFLYQQDIKVMVENPWAFDAFICAATAYLERRGQTEPRPRGFPKAESWIAFPKKDFIWI